jgi:SAM-dependent methyltransferase
VNRRAGYGIDAPGVVLAFTVLGIAGLWLGARWPTLRGVAIPGAVFAAEALLMVWSSRVGKPRVVRRMLEGLGLPPDARVLDVGCGRGQVLIEVAKRLPAGRAVGVDLWRRGDQSGNDRRATLENAAREGVAERVKVHDGDARRLPFDDGCFDAVVSSLVVHNIPDRAGRADAVREMARMLRPGGRLALLDFRHTADYAATLRTAGLTEVRRSGIRFGLFPPVRIVTARKDALAAGGG